MGDMFAEGVRFEHIGLVLEVVHKAKQHTFIILTKHPAKMADYFSYTRGFPVPIPNLITGTSITDQATADLRVPELLKVPGRHCISYEPALAAVNMRPWFHLCNSDLAAVNRAEMGIQGRIEEIYLGGQTGPGASPLHPQWVRDVRDPCKAAGIKFWFKSWGEWKPYSQFNSFDQSMVHAGASNNWPKTARVDGESFYRVGRAKAGRTLDGEVHDGN